MARHVIEGDVRRTSVLLGKTNAGKRASALWGKGGRGSALVAISVFAAALAGATFTPDGRGGLKPKAHVPPSLLDAASTAPERTFDVIVQTSTSSDGAVAALNEVKDGGGGKAKGLQKKFDLLPAVLAEVTGAELVALVARDDVLAVTPDAPVVAASTCKSPCNKQKWPLVSELNKYWAKLVKRAVSYTPTIAIVDSGIQNGTTGGGYFGQRIVHTVDFASLAPNANNDGRGHGTFVAGLAANEQAEYTGAAPNAKLVSIDVLNDDGVGRTSDVIAAADWILQNRKQFDIRVANFSLHASHRSSFMYDPLNKAVQRLWLNGVVVVAASGNYASGGERSGILYPPGNDPFVITAGAVDTRETEGIDDDQVAPWSAWGYTADGFLKPEVVAAGRYINSVIPPNSSLAQEFPARKLDGDHMWLSGTSFAAGVVTGAAAALLAQNPSLTPDQVKGALMATAKLPLGVTSRTAFGRGIIQAEQASKVAPIPNPNAALNLYTVTDPLTGLRSFAADDWKTAAIENVSWDSVSWSDVSWSDVSWSDVSWSDGSWESVSWSDVSWSDVSWDSGVAPANYALSDSK